MLAAFVVGFQLYYLCPKNLCLYSTKQMFFGFVALPWTCVRVFFACPNWYAAMISILLMVLSTFSTIALVTESSSSLGALWFCRLSQADDTGLLES